MKNQAHNTQEQSHNAAVARANDTFLRGQKSSKLQTLLGNENGGIEVGCILALAATPLTAWVGSYIGEGIGYVVGNIIDCIPFVNMVAPWLAERTGLITDPKSAADLNENLYQTTGAIAGFYGGLTLPWKRLASQ